MADYLESELFVHDGAVEEKRSRRRGAVLERAILEAAWQELSERGWQGFSVEGVAGRSGAAKTVIYRRWRNRVDLAQDMLIRAAADSGRATSQGALRADLIAFLEGMSRFLGTPFGEAARGVTCEGDPAAQPSIFGATPVVAAIEDVIDQAVARGDLEGRPSALAMNLGHAVVMSEFLHTGRLPGPEQVTEIVDDAWLPALRATSS
ncbi:TetR/AcrR family transcriptional regulator [Nocardioides sp. SYSU DS0663]|uniref:TetR/AcrR family transcriptional regulator n=1 Tax=Nocardioides sp. SYSU DS0663 TaxID=3416445 RepID=UPI003F4C7C3F